MNGGYRVTERGSCRGFKQRYQSMELSWPSSFLIFHVIAILSFLSFSHCVKIPSHLSVLPFNRTSFPKAFIFGAGISAFQAEGAAHIDGKGPSVWDTLTKKHPEAIKDHSNADVADDFYHRYKEDIKLIKKIGLDSFRFSLSWPRILPKGKVSKGVNPLGVKFYNNLINELLLNGIQPFVTLFHFDTPQALEDEYGSFLSPNIVKDYLDYADFCFKTFGDRVKYWVTMNEPNIVCMNGYDAGTQAPARCSRYAGNCTAGNSATEPYLAAHHMLLSHAAAVKLYRQKYQPYQKGKIGITLVTHWFEPKFQNAASYKAASRALDFFLGWFADPITYGDYPKSMKSTGGKRLPKFTQAESKLLKGSYDFMGMNYYTTNYAENAPLLSSNRSYAADRHVTFTTQKNGIPIGNPTALSWLFICPKGLKDLLLYIKKRYNNPPVYINENGLPDENNSSIPIKKALKDSLRIRYHHAHLSYLLEAIKEGADVKGYHLWSFMDNFEWDHGYTVRFGLVYVDYKNNAKRYLKYSAYWLKKFLLR